MDAIASAVFHETFGNRWITAYSSGADGFRKNEKDMERLGAGSFEGKRKTRRVSRMAVFLVVLFTMFSFVCSSAVLAEGKTYNFYISGHNPSDSAQWKSMLDEVARVAEQRNLIKIKIILVSDQQEFDEKLREGSMDFFLNSRMDSVWKIIANKSAVPIGVPIWFGEKKNELCVYLPKNRPEKSIRDLSGAKVITYNRALVYYELRKLIGSPPEDFFSVLKSNVSGVSMTYSITTGESDAAFFETYAEKLMKFANPGPIKNLRRMSCVTIPYAPIFRSKKTPDEDAEILVSLFDAYRTYPELSKMAPMFKKFKLTTVPFLYDDYKEVIAIYNEAASKGWDKDFKRWNKMADQEGK